MSTIWRKPSLGVADPVCRQDSERIRGFRKPHSTEFQFLTETEDSGFQTRGFRLQRIRASEDSGFEASEDSGFEASEDSRIQDSRLYYFVVSHNLKNMFTSKK